MKHVHTTWYRLADGTQGDPNDVAPDADGVLRHKSGVAVALRESGVPWTSGARDKVVAKASGDATAGDKPAATAKAGKKDAAAAKDREIKASDDGKKYETR